MIGVLAVLAGTFLFRASLGIEPFRNRAEYDEKMIPISNEMNSEAY